VKALALLLLIAASASPWAAPVTVTDFAGREIRLEQPARRIVALAPHIVENVFSAGAGGRLVGVVSDSNFPPAAREIPQVGDYQAWSLEAILARDPDLVLLWGSGGEGAAQATLRGLGIPTYVSEPRRLEHIPRAIRAIGALAGTAAAAEAAARRFENELVRLRSAYQRTETVSVFYQVWHRPLQTLNGEHLVSDVIRLCGGYNLFADAPHLAPRVSLEAVLARNPQVILASGSGKARPAWLDDWKQYPRLAAVRNGALLAIHADLIQRPTPRVLAGARTLCGRIAELQRKDARQAVH